MSEETTNQTPPSDQPAAAGAAPTSDERTMAMLAHLLAIFVGWLAPLIIWLVKKDSSPFVDDQGKEALNFQITVFIALVISGALTFVVIGCFLAPAVAVANIIFCIIAGLAANKGERYRYPFAIRLIK
jgi:uncharacterized Tic20 family protein